MLSSILAHPAASSRHDKRSQFAKAIPRIAPESNRISRYDRPNAAIAGGMFTIRGRRRGAPLGMGVVVAQYLRPSGTSGLVRSDQGERVDFEMAAAIGRDICCR